MKIIIPLQLSEILAHSSRFLEIVWSDAVCVDVENCLNCLHRESVKCASRFTEDSCLLQKHASPDQSQVSAGFAGHWRRSGKRKTAGDCLKTYNSFPFCMIHMTV